MLEAVLITSHFTSGNTKYEYDNSTSSDSAIRCRTAARLLAADSSARLLEASVLVRRVCSLQRSEIGVRSGSGVGSGAGSGKGSEVE